MARIFSPMVAILLWTLLAAGPAAATDFAGSVAGGQSPADWFNQQKDQHDDWDVTGKISPGMAQILSQALIDFGSYKPRSSCEAAAAGQAWYALADAAYAGPLGGFLDAIKGALGGIKKIALFGADPSAAADALEAARLAQEAFDQAKDKGAGWLKQRLKEIWQGKKLEVLKRAYSSGPCEMLLIAIWDKANGTYEITIYGDCNCALVGGWEFGSAGSLLKTFAVQLKGTVTPDIVNGDGVYRIGFPKITVAANCGCPKTRTGVNPPPGGGGMIPVPPAAGGGGGSGGGATPPPPQPNSPQAWRDVRTNCPPCQSIVDQIHAAQGERDKMDREFRDAKATLDAANSRGDKADAAQAQADMDVLTAREGGLIRLEQGLWARLKACEKEKCPEHAMRSQCPEPPGDSAMVVGPNDKAGSGAHLTDKAVSTAIGVLGGVLGHGGGGGAAEAPPLITCDVAKSERTTFNDPASGVALSVAARRRGDDLIVFANVVQSPDAGTFQTAFLENAAGERMAPSDAHICELWGEWSVSVSWTRTTYVNNQVTNREQGGWSKAGQFRVPNAQSNDGGPDGLWRQLGFSNASHGARGVALQFAAPRSALTQPIALVVHVTRPSQDPVTTVPFVIQVSETQSGFTLERIARSPAAAACRQASLGGNTGVCATCTSCKPGKVAS